MSTNHFDQFDEPSRTANYFDKFDEAPSKPKRSLWTAINDNVIEVANAAAGNASAVANFVRPGNAASQWIDKNFIEAGQNKQSDVVKTEKARYAQEMEQAQGFGDEVSATLGHVARNPLLAAAQAAGSFAGPGLAVGGARAAAGALGMVGKGATRTGLAAGAGFGMASAGGDAAGTAYELSRQGGATDEQALAAARGASVIPAAIGAAGGLVGAERLVAGAKGFGGGLAARALKTGAVEGAQEALEEGVTQYEGQRAAVPFNPELDPTKGVAGAATMGAVLGGMTGGGASLLTGQNQPARKPSEDLGLNPDSGPISKVAAAAVDEGRAAAPMQPEQPAQPEDGLSLAPEEQAQPQGPTMAERLAALPEQARAQAEQLLREIADERVPAGVKRFRAHELQQVLDAYPVPEKTDTITPEERAAMGPIVRGYDPATGEAPGRPLELEGERYQDGIDFTADEQPSQSAYQDAINRIALESYQTPGQPLAMEQASRLRDAAQEQGIPATIVPHPSGKGFDVQATAVLPEDARQQVAQDPVAAALPYDNSPTGRMVADAQGNARPELRPEAVEREVRWNQELAQMDAEARRRAELGLSNRTPVTPLQEDASPQQPQSHGQGPLAPQGGRQPAAQQQPQEVQFQASTGRDVAMRNAPGVENAPIDVEASEVRPNPALGMTRRLSYGSDGQSLEQGQGTAAQPGPDRAGTQQQTPPALPGPSNLRERIEAFRQKQAGAARMAQQVGQAPGTAAALPAPAADAKQVASSARQVSASALNDSENVSNQAQQAIKNDSPASPAANLRERLERFRQKRAEASAAAQQPVPPENSTSLAGAQITARQAQQAGAKARQQAKQAQRQAERAQAAPEETGLRVGVAPGSADPVTVRDGVVHIGEYEAVNYDTGEPVTVPKGSTRADVARALKDAGVLSSRQKMFGLSEKAQEVMFSRSAMKSTEANIARGHESLAKALNEKTTVHRAMFRNGLGWVDFVWGSEGRVKPSGKTQGAMGIAHILEARQRKDGLSEQEAIQSLSRVVESIALGQEVARLNYDNSVAVRIENAGYRVSLTKNPGSNAWVVTAFEVSQVHERSGFDTRPSTQPISTLSREKLGADSMATGDTSPSLKGATHRDSAKRGGPTGADSTGSISAQDIDANPDILYSKSAKPVTNPTAIKMRRAMVQRTVDALAKGWAKAPNVTVVDNMQDERVPEAVRKADEAQRSQGAMGEPEGFWYRGQVYLVASALPTSADAARVLYHEVLGHHGLRGHFGKDLDRVLDQVIKLRRKDVQAKAQEYGLDMSNPEHAGYAAEEVLAELAQSRPDLGFVQRAIAAIRNFLRTHVPGFKVLELTDADIVQGYLLPARGWVERGADAGSAADGPMLSRSGGTDSEAQRQFKETERAYGGKAAYERAKAAGKTKLTYGQWVQVRTPNFKAWFGDWEAVRAQERLDAMEPVQVRVPDAWRGLGHAELRQKMAEELDRMVREKVEINHPELGSIQVGRVGAKKSKSTSPDPAKVLVTAGIEAFIPASIYARSTPSFGGDGPDIAGYSTLLASVDVEGTPLVAAFTVRHQADGRWYYNAVTLHDPNRKARDSNGRPDQQAGSSVAPLAGLGEFSRKSLARVNPEAVSKVVDSATGEPLVVYHGTGADFSVFDGKKRGSHTREVDARQGFFLSSSPEIASEYAEEAGANGGANIMPAYVSLQNPLVIDEGGRDYDAERFRDYIVQAQEQGHDGVLLRNTGDGMFKNGRTGDTVIAFRSEQIKSAIGNNGDFDPANPDIRFSRSAVPSLSEVAETGRDAAWTGPAASKWDDFIYKMQDKHIDTKRALEAVRATGKAVSDELDVYLQEELYHGRAAKRTEDFVKQELEPLLQYMSSAGLKMADVEEYLHARHAKEANAVIAQRNPDLPDGGSGMTNAEADAVLQSYAPMRLKLLEKAAAKVDAIIAGTRNTFVEYGLESQDVVDGWAQSFAHYVPLMREQEGDGMAGLGTGQGFSVKGKEVKGRTGSTKKVVDILANIAMQRERAIVRGEKNRVAAALVGLAKAHPSDFWKVDVVPTRQVLGKDGMVKTEHDPLYKQRDNVVVAKIPELDAKTGKVLVKEHAVLFNENDARALRMAQALKNLDAAQLEGMLGATAKVTRYLAAINTQYNPIFGITNLARDLQGAAINLQSTALAGRQGEVLTQALPALRGIYAEMRSQRKGSTTGSQWSKLWEEFQEVGGQTGYRDQFRTSADRGQAIGRALDPSSWAETNWGRFFTAGGRLKVPLEMVRKGMAPVLNWLDDYNTAMENGVRLAAYRAGLDAGLSKERAASIAKNLTTNFNRKGQVAQQVGALYAFFNASMQGTARIGEALFTMEPGQPKTLRLSALGRKVVSGGVLLGAGQALMLAAAGFGDDEPPEHVRERNLVIPNPLSDKSYFTIPLPLGLHVLPNLGRIPAEFALGGFENPAEQVLKVAGLFADAFNPIGNAGLSAQTIVPTVLDPWVALTENRDFAGREIAKKSFNPITPGHALARDTATAHAKLIAEAVNFLSGGTAHVRGALSPTPDQIDYLIGQFTGGVGRELSKLQQSVVGAAQGDDVPAHKVPLLGRFYGDANSPSAKQAAFYNHLDSIARHAEQVKGLRLEGEAQAANTYLQEHPEARLALAAKATSRAIQKMREQRRELEQQGAAREQVRQIEEQMIARMEQFNALVERHSI